jgi:hypothetical protein
MQDLKLYSSAAENSSLSGHDAVSFGEWSQHYVGLFTAHVHKCTVPIQMTGTAHPVTQGHIPNYPHETAHFFSKIRSVHACVNWKCEAYK